MAVEPRGQLWFELERICKDFVEYSGLDEKAALRTLVSVLGNLLAEQQAALERLPPDIPGQTAAGRG
jgi:hypothetical protein